MCLCAYTRWLNVRTVSENWEYGGCCSSFSSFARLTIKVFRMAHQANASEKENHFLMLFFYLDFFFTTFSLPTFICVNVMCRCCFDLFSIWSECTMLCCCMSAKWISECECLLFGDRLSIFTFRWLCIRSWGIPYILALALSPSPSSSFPHFNEAQHSSKLIQYRVEEYG